MHRGEKNKNIADGRKGRVGQRLPCTTTTAHQENNAGGGEEASEDRPRPSGNQSRASQNQRRENAVSPKTMLCLKSEGAML